MLPAPMRTLPTSLAGVLLIEPAVHGDHRGFFAETFRADALAAGRRRRRVRAGQPLALAARHAARHALPDARPGRRSSCAARAARSSTSSSTCAAARRRSADGRASRSTTSRCASCSCPIGFAHGFCVTSEVADVVYKCSSYYDAATEAGIAYDDPAIGIEWPIGVEPIVSERDANGAAARRRRGRAAVLSGAARRLGGAQASSWLRCSSFC